MRITHRPSSKGEKLLLCLLITHSLILLAQGKEEEERLKEHEEHKEHGDKHEERKEHREIHEERKEHREKHDGRIEHREKHEERIEHREEHEERLEHREKHEERIEHREKHDRRKDDEHKEHDDRHDRHDEGQKGRRPNKHDDEKFNIIEVTEGEMATMKCPLPPDTTDTLVWKSGNSVLFYGDKTIMEHKRIRNYKETLTIYNVTRHDAKTYTCSHRSGASYAFHLSVTELHCYNVSNVPHGYVVYMPEPRHRDNFLRYGTKVIYFCHVGYSVVGPEVRYCTDPELGWTGKEPSCQNSFVVNLDHRVSVLEKLYENYALTYGGISERVSAAEDESRHQFTLLEYLLHDLTNFRLKTQQHQEKLDVELRSLRLSILHQRYQQQRVIAPAPNFGGPIYFNEGPPNGREPQRFY